MTIADRLEATADLLQKGWTQGAYADEARGLIAWNDDPRREKAEVVAVVRKAAMLARAQS